MRFHRTDSREAGQEAAVSKPVRKSAPTKNWRLIIIAGVVLFLAAFLRVFFAFDISVGSDFALSGGTAASNNLYALEKLLSEGAVSFVNGSMYYPYGSANVAPMLFTLVMYPFALIANAIVADPVVAASATLALSGPVLGVLACIPTYYIGRELTGKNMGGLLAMLFMAVCPVAVQQTVLSNGSGISFALFFASIAVLFLIRALKACGQTDSARDNAVPKSYLVPAAVAGIMLAIVGLTWTGYRAVILPVLVLMVAQVLIDRFRGRDPMPAAKLYAVVIALGALIPAVYYLAAGQWELVASGTTVLSVIALVMCVAYSALARKPWTMILPAFVIIAVAVFALLAVFLPDLYSATVGGNSLLSPEYSAILSESRLSLSTLAAYFGWLTFWFLFIVVAYRLYKFRENAASPLFLATILWPFFMFVCCCHTASEAAVASIAFSATFAMLVIWILDKVDIPAYFNSIRAADGTTKVRRLFKPMPFITVLVAVLLVAAPNMMYAVSAGVSTNQAEEMNETTGTEQFGGIGYYVQDNDTWKVPEALKDAGLTGTMGGWFEYSDYIAMSGLNSITDAQGNGALSVSQILLSNAVDGSSTAAMLVALLMYSGMTDDVRTALGNAGLSQAQIDVIAGVLDSADYRIGDRTVRDIVTTDNETYGHLSEDISDTNVKYLYLTNYMSDELRGYGVSEAYEAVCDATGKSFDHILLTGDMMPLYYSNVFIQMALMTGHVFNSNTYAVEGFMEINWTQYYLYGNLVYDYTDEMYDSLLYRGYIGMTPEEAGYSSLSEYIQALQHADASVKMVPCYGLSNYEVTYWQVMYNPDPNAESDSDGWVQLDAAEAQRRQTADGGVINYLSGLPLIISYAGNHSDNAVEVHGHVTDGTNGIAGIQVSAVDAGGVVRATTFTKSDGSFTLRAEVGETIVYYAASSGTSGVLLDSKVVAAGADYDLTARSASSVTVNLRIISGGTSVPVNDPEDYVITLTGRNTGNVYTGPLSDFNGMAMAMDIYTVSVSNGSNTVYSGQFTVGDVDACTATFTLDTTEYTITVRDVYGTTPSKITAVRVYNDDVSVIGELNNGSVTVNLPRGTYRAEMLTGNAGSYSVASYMVTNGSFTVSTSASSRTLYVVPSATIEVPADAYGSVVVVSNDAYTASFVPDVSNDTITVPVSEVADTSYTVYYIKGSNMSYASVSLGQGYTEDFGTSGLTTAAYTKVTGTLRNASNTAVSGTLTFIVNGSQFYASAASDGSYTAYLPIAEATTVMVYATNNTDAYIGNVTITDGVADVTMTEADRMRSTVSWDGNGTDTYYSYTTVVFEITDGTNTVATIRVTTILNSTSSLSSSSNRYSLYLPENMGATITSTVNTVSDGLWYEDDNGAQSNTATRTIPTDDHSGSLTAFQLKNSGSITVRNDLDIDVLLKVGTVTGDAPTVPAGQTYEYDSGIDRRSVSVDLGSRSDSEASTAYYFDGTYAFDPTEVTGEIALSALMGYASAADAQASVIYKSVYVKSSEGDTVAFQNGDAAYEGYTDSDGYRQYLISRNGATSDTLIVTNENQVYYSNIDLTSTAEVRIDATSKVEARTVSGYVGVMEDGTITAIFNGITVIGTVEDGEYSLKLIDGTWDLKVVCDNDGGLDYLSDGTVTVNGSDRTYNMATDDGDNDIASTTASKTEFGVMTYVEMEFDITTLPEGQYSLAPGSGWYNFDVTYNGQSINDLYKADTSTEYIITVTGWYNSALTTLGSADLRVALESDDTTAYLVANFSDNLATSGSGTVYLDKRTDTVNSYSYSYVISADNTANGYVNVELEFTVPAGWVYEVEETVDGNTSYTPGDATTGGKYDWYVCPGVTELKVTFIKVDGVATSSEVPEFNATVTNVGSGDAITLASYTNTVSIDDDNVAHITGTSGSAEVTASDMGADGRGVLNALGDMPMIVWVLFALIVILIILTFWMSFKRGVFARRR